ncbi:MAG: hypothetical protein AAB309_03960 [Deltaproteobacteria bacterium]
MSKQPEWLFAVNAGIRMAEAAGNPLAGGCRDGVAARARQREEL